MRQTVTSQLTKFTGLSESGRKQGEAAHMDMKNEFLYTGMVLSKVKKRYIGSIRLKEGKEIRPELLDIKSHDFVKSSTTPEIKKFFEGIILDDNLY